MKATLVPTLAGVEVEWDRLCADADNPFVEARFLRLLETSGAVGPRTGWLPRYVLLRDTTGALVGGVPLYARGDSYGEYIFDWGWAEAAQRAGLRYYPKLTAAVPFTPATGPRLLGGAHVELVRAVEGEEARLGASGSHVLFCTEREQAELEAHGWTPRLSLQFHWENLGWRDWQDFSAALTRKRRHEMNRERRQAHEGVEIVVRRGSELVAEDWAALHRFYRGTVDGHGQIPYLGAEFWRQAPEVLGDRVVAVLALRGDTRVAGAFNLHKGRNLYGRYWGCVEDHKALHFEVCYYALIEWCLANGVTRFEAGAQGEHKLQRGFLPSLTRSAHRFAHPALRDAVGRFCRAEAQRVLATVAEYQEHSPFKPAA